MPVDVTGFVVQIQNDLVVYGLVILVGVDVGPKISMLRRLSDLRNGVPVKSIRVASGKGCVIARWDLPDWVRWHSPTKT